MFDEMEPESVTSLPTPTPEQVVSELQKALSDCDPSCALCCGFIRQLSQHVLQIHGHQNNSSSPSSSSVQIKIEDLLNVQVQVQVPLLQIPQANNTETSTSRQSQLPTNPREITTARSQDNRRSLRTRKRVNYEIDDSDGSDGTRSRSRSVSPEWFQDQQHESESEQLEISPIILKIEPIIPEDSNEVDTFPPDAETSADEEVKAKVKVITVRINKKRRKRRKNLSGFKPKPIYKCSICPRTFAWKKCLEIHHRTHTGEKPFVCLTCNKAFATYSTLKTHELSHRNKSDQEESDRPLAIKRKVKKKKKVKSSSSTLQEKPKPIYQCTVCPRMFAWKKCLEIHHRTHTGERPYVCGTCNKGFLSYSNLKTHEGSHDSTRVKKLKPKNVIPAEDRPKTSYPCTVCPRVFAWKKCLEIHARTHTGERPYVCGTCNKGFLSYSNLKTHETSHTGLLPYKCTQCDKGYKTKLGLDAHTLKHEGKKPFMCAECGSCFTSRSALNTHSIVHKTTEDGQKLKAVCCPHCDARFVRRECLSRHLWVHTGIKPHMCEFCGKSFTQLHSMKSHLRTHHPTNQSEIQSNVNNDSTTV